MGSLRRAQRQHPFFVITAPDRCAALEQADRTFNPTSSPCRQICADLHSHRHELVKFRTMQTNALRGLLTEYGEVMGKGRTALDKAIPEVLARVAERLPSGNGTRARRDRCPKPVPDAADSEDRGRTTDRRPSA